MLGVSLCESGAYFVETNSRVDTVPVSVLRNAATGIAVMQLEESDFGQLLGVWHILFSPHMSCILHRSISLV